MIKIIETISDTIFSLAVASLSVAVTIASSIYIYDNVHILIEMLDHLMTYLNGVK